MPARAVALAIGFAAATAPAASRDAILQRLAEPWPAPEAVDARAGVEVRFPSRSPFVIGDATGEPGSDPPTEAMAELFLPDGARRAAPIPAAVLLHGAAGVLYRRERTYARQFAEMGMAAMVVDVFGARRDRATGFIQRLLEITETMMIADAYGGLRYLAGRGDVDPRRVALIGFSYGGMASVLAIYEQVARRFAPRGLRFAAHAAFYGPCIARFEDPRTTGAPLLMLSGTEDEIIDPSRCAEIAGDLRGGGSAVRIERYQGAYHQWDGGRHGPYRIGRNLAGCRLRVERDGGVYDARTFLPMIGPLTRRVILGMCADDEGYLIGGDERIRARSNRDLGRFLAEAFGR